MKDTPITGKAAKSPGRISGPPAGADLNQSLRGVAVSTVLTEEKPFVMIHHLHLLA